MTSCRLSPFQDPTFASSPRPPHPLPIDFAVNAPAPLPESSRRVPEVSTASRSPRSLPSRSLGNDAADVAGAEVTVHQVLRRPIVVRNESPVTVLEPEAPMTVTLEIRPPQALMPSRLSIRRARRVP